MSYNRTYGSNNYNSLIRTCFYGGGNDAYNFPLEIMHDSEDLLRFTHIGKETDDEIGNGAFLLITENQYVMSYNRGMGQGAHNNAIARAWADINGRGGINYTDAVNTYHDAENKLLIGKFYSERERSNGPLRNLLVFSLYRGGKISQAEYDSFMNFYNEYAWVIRREKFKVCVFRGIDRTIDEAKDILESLIDPELDLSEIMPKEEKIIGESTTSKQNTK